MSGTISEDYRKGFEDAKQGALICCNQWRDYDLRCQNSKSVQGCVESITRMTPELHAEYLRKFPEHR
jgi:hypothetical protein